MKRIENIEKITNRSTSWQPNEIAFVKELQWVAGNLMITIYSQTRKMATNWPDFSEHFTEIVIEFKRASSIKFSFGGGQLQQITGFNIIDISNHGWDKINFEIEDYENGSVYFYCEAIEIKEVRENIIINN